MLLQVACLALALPFASGAVQFTSSSLYDIYDLRAKEVALPKCDNGCRIYVSSFWTDNGYLKDIVVHDYTTGKDKSLSDIAKAVAAGSQKQAYELTAKGRYSILNFNGQAPDGSMADVSVYVVDLAMARSIDYEIYDAASMARANVVPRGVVTVMGAKQFLVKADKGAPNSITARLAGFDNAAENNVDGCNYAYKTQTFDGFEFHVNGPIVSLVFGMKNLVAIQANYNWLNVRDLSKGGFIAPPGFNGCTKVDPATVFRQWQGGFYGEEFDLHSNTKLRVTWDVDSNVTQDIVIKDMTNSKRNTVSGVKTNVQIVMENTDFVTSYYNDAAPPNGFIARHVPTRV